MKKIVFVVLVLSLSLNMAGAIERNLFETVRDQLASHQVDDRYDDGTARFVWLNEPATIELSIGSVEVQGLLSVSPSGYVSTVDFVGPQWIDTPAGTVESIGVTFHENGPLKIVHTGDTQPLTTPVGEVALLEYVRFFENGVPEELRPAEPVVVAGAFGELLVDEVIGFHPNGTVRSLQFTGEQVLLMPDGTQRAVVLVNFHDDGTIALVQFSAPLILETANLPISNVAAAAYRRDGSPDLALLTAPERFATPGGTFTMPVVVFLPDGGVAGGVLVPPQSFTTPLGEFPLLAVAFRPDGSIERAAPLEPRVIDGVEYSIQRWMLFDDNGRLAGGVEMSMF